MFKSKSLLLIILINYLEMGCVNQPAVPQKEEVRFVIVIPSYNNELWALDNLRSACTQKSSQPYQVICVNDCSTDRTGEIMDEYVKENHLESMVTVIHNNARLGHMANWYNTIHKYIPDHNVVVNLDGDDILAHDNVLLTLEKYYVNPNCWLTYGSAVAYPSGNSLPRMSQGIPDRVFHEKEIRKYEFVAQHLRTFKAGLFKKINKDDLSIDGEFVQAAVDMAFMLPMLEMCSPKGETNVNHSAFIPELLYLYRTNNPISIFRTRRAYQQAIDLFIRSKKPYESLDSL